MRRKKPASRPVILSDVQLSKRISAQKADQREKNKWIKVKKVIGKFRPKKSDRGKIILLGAQGSRAAAGKNRRVIAIYVNTKGKKSVVRQYDRTEKKLEKFAKLRKVNSVDVSRVKSRRAQAKFLNAYSNRVAYGTLSEIPESGKSNDAVRSRKISCAGTRYCGQIFAKRIDRQSDAAKLIGKELARASNSTKSKRDFLVTIGISCQVVGTGETFFIVTRRRFARRDGQHTTNAEGIDFIGREIYGFLARDLQSRGLVMTGSATHIKNLPENKGVKNRHDWKKDGFLWEAHDSDDVKLVQVEYRIDQQTFGE